MERMPSGGRPETVEKEARTNDIKRLVDRLLSLQDSSVAHLCLLLLASELDPAQINDLANIICADKDLASDETAFYTLHRIPDLPAQSRDALLAHIVDLADKTVCNETLLFVPNLGPWETRLRQVLER